jgi:hypothetical protein
MQISQAIRVCLSNFKFCKMLTPPKIMILLFTLLHYYYGSVESVISYLNSNLKEGNKEYINNTYLGKILGR